MLKGIDVSKHNGYIDWKKVKSDSIDFAVLRAGYGRFDEQRDERFEEYYRLAKANSIKVGAYLYSYAKSVDDAKKEAAVFIKWLKGKQFEMPVFYDVEENAQALKGKSFISSIIKAFCGTMEAAGYYVGVYTSKYWLENYVDDECKKKYDIWLAQWASKPSYNGEYGMWQYSASGKVNGINGNVDMNFAYKDYSALIVSKGFNGFPLTAPSPEAPETPETPETPESHQSFKAGTKIRIVNAPLYASSTATKPSISKKTGNFYIYDGIEIKARYRITSRKDYVNKKPASKHVTGYVKNSDIKVI